MSGINATKLFFFFKQSDRVQEALFLLCKAHFVMEDFHSCVKYCNQGGADDIVIDSQSRRKSRLVADGFAYKGNVLHLLLTIYIPSLIFL